LDAAHFLKTHRYLTCPHCSHLGFDSDFAFGSVTWKWNPFT
jgi:hypothetical protein